MRIGLGQLTKKYGKLIALSNMVIMRKPTTTMVHNIYEHDTMTPKPEALANKIVTKVKKTNQLVKIDMLTLIITQYCV